MSKTYPAELTGDALRQSEARGHRGKYRVSSYAYNGYLRTSREDCNPATFDSYEDALAAAKTIYRGRVEDVTHALAEVERLLATPYVSPWREG